VGGGWNWLRIPSSGKFLFMFVEGPGSNREDVGRKETLVK
jgi:hypothetical protein